MRPTEAFPFVASTFSSVLAARDRPTKRLANIANAAGLLLVDQPAKPAANATTGGIANTHSQRPEMAVAEARLETRKTAHSQRQSGPIDVSMRTPRAIGGRVTPANANCASAPAKKAAVRMIGCHLAIHCAISVGMRPTVTLALPVQPSRCSMQIWFLAGSGGKRPPHSRFRHPGEGRDPAAPKAICLGRAAATGSRARLGFASPPCREAMGRGTMRSMVEERPSLPLRHGASRTAPPPHSLRVQGGDRIFRSQSADCQHIPRRQASESTQHPKNTASPARHRNRPS